MNLVALRIYLADAKYDEANVLMRVKHPKPNYPTDGLEQVYAVMAVLSRANAPMDANSIALTFKQGRKIASKITAVLAAGLRYGDLNSTDGGRTYQLRRAA